MFKLVVNNVPLFPSASSLKRSENRWGVEFEKAEELSESDKKIFLANNRQSKLDGFLFGQKQPRRQSKDFVRYFFVKFASLLGKGSKKKCGIFHTKYKKKIIGSQNA